MDVGIARNALAALALLITPFHLDSVAAAETPVADGADVTKVPDKRIVDCLLQGQIRKLGTTVYQLPPRPLRLPAIDCEIRGGDFLVYDRANFATSLSHWLSLAKEGDAKAQIYVGEIFERGLGRQPDYAQAANWYRVAAASGSPVAQINLAQLYEKGLGVPKDPLEAERLYALAFGPGLDSDVSLDPGSIDDPRAEVRALEEKLKDAQRESALLTSQLQQAQQSLAGAERDLEQQQRAEQRLTEELAAAEDRYDKVAASSEQAGALMSELEQSRERLAGQQAVVARLQDEIDRNRRRIDAYESDFSRISELEAELTAQTERYEATKQELEQARTALTGANERLAEQQRAFEAERQELEAARDSLEAAGNSAKTREALAAELEDREAQQAALAESLDEMRQETVAYRDRSEALQDQLQQLRSQNSQLAASREEADLYQREAERLKSLLAESRAQLEAIESAPEEGGEVDRMQAELERVRGEADKYSERIRQLEAAQASFANLTGPSIQIIRPESFSTRGLSDVIVSASDQYQIVGKVTAPAGVLSVFINQQQVELNDNYVFQSVIDLLREKTPVDIIAIDNQGKRTEQALTLITQAAQAPDRPRIPNVEFGEYHALLIGNDSYEMLPDLVTPVGDVRSIGAILTERYGFQTVIIENGTRQQIMDKMYELLGKLTSEDNLLIYYAGHGEYVTDTDRGVWLPVDANPSSPANWITNVEINDYLKQIRAKQIVVVADSCYSGALTRSAVINLRPGLTDEEYEAHLRKMAEIPARVVLTSGALAPVLDSTSPDSKHSVFAAALIDVLTKNHVILSAQDLGRTVAAKVSLAASKVGYEQEPQYAPLNHANHQGGDFFFVPEI